MSMPAEDWNKEVGRIYSATQFAEEVEVHFPEKERVRRARKRIGRVVFILLAAVAALSFALLWMRGVNMGKEAQQEKLNRANAQLHRQIGTQANRTLDTERQVLFQTGLAADLNMNYTERNLLRIEPVTSGKGASLSSELYPTRRELISE